MSDRYYKNPYLETFNEINLDTFNVAAVEKFIVSSFPLLTNKATKSIENGKEANLYCGYCGYCGILLTLYRMKKEILELHDKNIDPLCFLFVIKIPLRGLPQYRSRHIGFCSDELSLHLLTCWFTKTPFDIHPEVYSSSFRTSSSLPTTPLASSLPLSLSATKANELLYGRAGLALMIDFYHQKGMMLVNNNVVQDISNHIPLQEFPWSWHDKEYYGAAHGTAGILLALHRLNHCHNESMFHELLTQASLSSGNFKSSSDSKSNKLVQWCHGTPGMLPLLLDYYEYEDYHDSHKSEYGSAQEEETYESKYECIYVEYKERMQAVDQKPNPVTIGSTATTDVHTSDSSLHTFNLQNKVRCHKIITDSLNIVWERGFLTKGSNICHGLAGNGYVFLSAYLSSFSSSIDYSLLADLQSTLLSHHPLPHALRRHLPLIRSIHQLPCPMLILFNLLLILPL